MINVTKTLPSAKIKVTYVLMRTYCLDIKKYCIDTLKKVVQLVKSEKKIISYYYEHARFGYEFHSFSNDPAK